MKLQPNALRFHNWQGEVTRSLLWVVGCFVSLYSSYESCVNVLVRKMSFMIGFLYPFSHDPSKAEANFPFPFCWVVMVFVFFLWQNITFPFPFCWVVMAFVFPLAKTSHFLFPFVGLSFCHVGNWKLNRSFFASKLKKYFDQVSLFLPSSPKEHENQECF